MALKEIVGHASQIKIFQSSIQKGTLAHAYLFSGLEGIGKEKCARELTKVLNCEKGGADSCDTCSVCLRIDGETFSDFHVIVPSGASRTIKIDDVQKVQKSLNLSRYEGKAKVILFTEADCLNEAASNALLKILEEPVEKTYFFLITANHEAVLPTIRSRCRQVPFYPLADSEVEQILTQSEVKDPTQREFLVRLSEGSIGRALRFFEEKGRQLRQSVIKFALSKSSSPTEALFASEQFQKSVEQDKAYLWDILKIFEGVYRDLLMLQIAGNEKQLLNPDWAQGLNQQKDLYTVDQLEAKVIMIERIRTDLHMNIQVKFALDYLLLFLIDKEKSFASH